MKYLFLLAETVEAKISERFTDKFAVIFDGLFHYGTYFASIFFSYPEENDDGFLSTCVAFSPLENEDDESADAHVELIDYVINLYKKARSNVVAVIDDNFNVKKAVTSQLDCHFVGCDSHRFNLAVKDVIQGHCGLIDDIKSNMSNLSFT